MASSVSLRAATPTFIACLHGFTIVRYLYWFFRHVSFLVLFWGVCSACAGGSCADSCCCLAQCCRGGSFFPNSADFALILGLSVLFQEFFAFALVFLGCTYGVAFLLRMPLLRLGHCLRLLALWFSLRTSSLVVPAFMWGSFLGRRSSVFFLSSCWARGWLLLSRWLEFACVPLPAAPAVFPQHVLPQVTLRGLRKLFWLQLPVLLLRCSSVCWVCGVFGAALGFPPCAVLFFRGLRFCAGCPSGFLPFLSPYAWPTAALVA